MRTSLLFASIAAGCLLMANADPASAQTRTWVSGVGDDVNPCSRTAPCKTFAGAISKTAPNGEINCLDPGGFGAVTITKSMTIDCAPFSGGILAAGTNGINVNAAGILVVLRNLTIHGHGTGLVGINFITGISLEIDNVTIQGFSAGSALGINFVPNTANSILQVNDSIISTNGIAPSTGGGIAVVPTAGGNAIVAINNTKIENNAFGLAANSGSGAINMVVRNSIIANNRGPGILSDATNSILVMVDGTTVSNNFQAGISSGGANSLVRINNSVVSGNATGVASSGGGVLRSYKNNAINGNGSDGTPIAQENLN
jgi:hypothetical protein